jgi:hypothetical protein
MKPLTIAAPSGRSDRAEWHVDEKHRTPAETKHVHRHQHTAKQEAGGAAKAKHDAVDGERLRPRVI